MYKMFLWLMNYKYLFLSLSRQVLQNNNIYFRRKSRVRVLRKLDH